MVGRSISINIGQIGLHGLFWFCYVILSGILTGISDESYTLGIQSELMMLPVKIALVYVVLLYFLPLYFEKGQQQRAIIGTLVVFLIAVLMYRLVLLGIIFPFLYPLRPISFWNERGFLLVAFDLFTALAAALSVKLTRMYLQSKRQQEVLEKEKLRSELNYLRSQTNPHYLFNTLNTLYGLALRKDEQTPEAILRMSQILDFTLHQARNHTVPLETELRIVRNVIDLEKMRTSAVVDIRLVEQLDAPHMPIAPMLLLPFVENAFKHGVATAPTSPYVHMKIIEEEGILMFTVKNNFRSGLDKDKNQESLGLQNVQRQLELLYKGHYDLLIEKAPDEHVIHLNLNLKAIKNEW
jgi:two-component system, LytTR family, sensor kinase